MADNLSEILEGLESLSPRQLTKLARQAAKKADQKRGKALDISPSDRRLAHLHAAVIQTNKDMKLSTKDTLDLLVRRMRLGLVIVDKRDLVCTDEGPVIKPSTKNAAKRTAAKKSASAAIKRAA